MNITANNKQFCSMELLSERKIDSYLTYYRNLFDNGRVMKLLQKMHLLEDHLLEWIKHYKVGMGLHGEQGGESLHATFNNLNRLHWNQRNPLKRLCLTMKSHFTEICPTIRSHIPKIKHHRKSVKRKLLQ